MLNREVSFVPVNSANVYNVGPSVKNIQCLQY